MSGSAHEARVEADEVEPGEPGGREPRVDRLRDLGELVERSLRVEPARPARDQPDERSALRSFYARLTHACTSSHARAPARTSRGADPVTSTMVDG